MTFSLDFRTHSEIGPLRKNNQDSGFASPNMLVVADGMGGAAAGDLASTVAITTIDRIDQRLQGEEMLTVLGDAVIHANDRLADLVAADHSLDGMGTTVTGAMFSGEQIGVVHIGDSRAYLLRNGHLERLTTDHSWVMSLVAEGKISEAEAETHPHRNLLLKVLNGQPTHRPDTLLVDLQEGDRLLFCSDGLCGFANDEQILEHLQGTDLDRAMDGLIQQAYHGGGADNITIILADVLPQSDELDARPAQVIGAAVDTTVPEIDPTSTSAAIVAEEDDEEQTADVVIDPERVESLRYAPTLVKPRRWLGPVLSSILVLVVLAGLGFGGVAYAKSQYYVGSSPEEKVTIYNGIPGQLLGVKFQRVAETSEVTVDDLPTFYQNRVAATIQADDLPAARRTVAELRSLANACRAKRAQRNTPPQEGPSSSPSTGPSSSVNPSSMSPSASTSPESIPAPESALSQPQTTASSPPGSTPTSAEDC